MSPCGFWIAKKVSARGTRLALAIVVGVLAGATTPVTAMAMTGGITQRPEPGWTVRIDASGVPNCSGELIAPQWVITAGHCTLDWSASVTTVRIKGRTVRAKRVFHDPRYTKAQVQFPDVGLIELPVDAVAAYGASVLPLGTADDLNYFANRGVTVFGYGKDESGHMTSIVKKSPDGAWKMPPYCQVKNDQCFTRSGSKGTSVQPGDSGGAWVGWRDGGWRLLAVVSGFLTRDEPLHSKFTAGTSPASPSVASWIASHVPAPAQPGGGPVGGQPGGGDPGATNSASGSVSLAQGPAAPQGYRYAISLTGFAGGAAVTVVCRDSVDPGGFYSFTLTTDASGNAYTAAYCYSGDGPDHWVTANTAESNHAQWTGQAPAPPPPSQPTYAETVGGAAHTWTNYTNAGGTEGPTIPAYATVQIACKLQGFRVADGNTWWYRIASSPWNGGFYVSADAFYNNGQTSGSLHGTPFVDGIVRDC
jgi:hypothetical protein